MTSDPGEETDNGLTFDEVLAQSREDRLAAERAHLVRRERERDAVLASDSDRDTACQALSQAFSKGRLLKTEFEERTTRALAARTHGELDDVLAGLGGYGTPPPRTAAAAHTTIKRVAFWICAFFASPFIFFGTMLLLAGDGFGERIAGIIMLAIVLPGPVMLYRWAHPKA